MSLFVHTISPHAPRRAMLYGLVTALAFFLLSAMATVGYYVMERNGERSEIFASLQAVAKLSTLLIDAETHKTFTHTEQYKSLDYLQQNFALSRVTLLDPRIRYVYTYIQKDGKLYYILDPSEPEDLNGDGVPDYQTMLMMEEDDEPGKMREAIAACTPMSEEKPTESKWGKLISAYAPILDDNGRCIGMLGVNMTANEYYERVNFMKKKLVFVIIFELIIALIMGLVVLYFWRIHEHSRQRMEDALMAAEEGNIMQSQFLSTISHELRTPLNGIIGTAQVIAAEPLTPRQKHHIDLLQTSSDHLLAMVDDILDFTTLQSGSLTLEPGAFELKPLMEALHERYRQKAIAKELFIFSYIDPTLPEVMIGDAARLTQLLSHLIDNAVKFTERGEIRLRVTNKLTYLNQVSARFEVTDTGIGIAANKHDIIFRRFSQVDSSTTRRVGGLGMGLALCRYLAERMGGHIGVISEPGVGSTFWVELTFALPD